MKPEQAFYQLLRPHLPGVAERIENAAGAGNPDFHCIWEGKTYWVECKVAKSKNWELMKLLEPSQIAWYRRYYLSGGTVFFIVRCEDVITIFCGLKERIFHDTKPFNYKSLKAVIQEYLLFDYDCP